MRLMSKTGWLLLSLVLLAPIGAKAQGPEDAEHGAVSHGDPSMVPMRPADSEAQRADTGLLGVNVPRFAVASLGGAAGGALVGTGGFLLANLGMCGGSTDSLCSLGALVLGGGFGAALGLVGGTLLVGQWMDGDGAWWGVLGGMALGVGAGLASANFFGLRHTGTLFGAIVVGTVLLGALGYELTSHHSAKQFHASRLTVAPTVLPGARGTLAAGLALGGTWY